MTQNKELFKIRIHRAGSWLKCAAKYSEDDDIAFITEWIAFNCCYAVDIDNNTRLSEKENFNTFIKKLAELDTKHEIAGCLWNNYSNFIRTLINNKYVFSPFWESYRNADDNWKIPFENEKRKAMNSLAQKNTAEVMGIVLDRLYCLRNQIVHGGATYCSKLNRRQIKDAGKILAEIMPVIIKIMENNYEETDFGDIAFFEM